MTPPRREKLQSAILHAIVQARPGTLDRDIAEIVGVTRPQISHLRAGERKLDLDELVALATEYGVVPVLGPLAQLGEADVVPRQAEPADNPVLKGIELSDQMTGLTRAIAEASADGSFSEAELASLERQHLNITRGLEQLRAGIRRPPAA